LLIAALVVAALGTVLIFVYVQNIKQDAYDGAKMVQVLVATEDVAPGTTASEASANGAFELIELPDEATATGSVSNIELIADQVALAPVFEGQQILLQMFGAPEQTSALSVPDGKLAISVQLGDPERVAGFLAPGSDVTIFATVSETGDAASNSTQVLLPEVQVIGVGTTTVTTQTTTTEGGEQTTEEVPRTVLTLAVDQQEAQRIISAQTVGELYFGLRGADVRVNAGRATDPQNLFR
jgi:pilus assembly protein CpaB